jgi:hypothetical protein
MKCREDGSWLVLTLDFLILPRRRCKPTLFHLLYVWVANAPYVYSKKVLNKTSVKNLAGAMGRLFCALFDGLVPILSRHHKLG